MYPLEPSGSQVWDMGVIKQPKIAPAVLPAALCAASRKKSRKSRIFSQFSLPKTVWSYLVPMWRNLHFDGRVGLIFEL